MTRIAAILMSVCVCVVAVMAVTTPAALAPALKPVGGPAMATAILSGAACGLAVLSFLIEKKILRADCDALQQMLSAEATYPAVVSRKALRGLAAAVHERFTDLKSKTHAATLRQKELEISLRVLTLERDRMQSIIQTISDGVLVTDAWDELILANASAANVLSFKQPQKLRQPVDQVVSDAKLVGLIREMRATQNASGRRVIEHRLKKDGQDRTYKVTVSSLDNEANGVLLLMHDMTHEAEVARMKNDFVSHVSHELRTPLASIKAYIEMLIDGEARDAKQAEEFYDVIQNEANRLGRLIDNILDVSRIEAGVVKANKQPMSLTVVLNEALEVIAPQAAAKRITVRQKIEPAINQVLADKDMIYRAVLNLLSNAVKYTPEGGTVTASTAIDASEKKIIVGIADTGVGIPLKDLPFVFDKFYRVEQNSGMAKGTGLGLALVKQVVETVHDGKVSVESVVGKGTTFRIEMSLC